MINSSRTRLIGIAAGMLKAKKEKQMSSSLYLNYGLLGLITNLKDKGYDAVMFQGDYKDIDTVIQEILSQGTDLSGGKNIFLLSVPSFLSLEWATEFARKIKKAHPSNKIIVGGRWVVDKNLEWVKNKFMGYADAYSVGCPDDHVELFADESRWSELETSKQYTHPFYRLDYTLLDNYKYYQPVLEVSRGCGRGCSFCLENSFAVCPLLPPESIFGQIGELQKIYDTDMLNIYFESSIFLPSLSWSKRFRALYHASGSRFRWRCTTRVDSANAEAFEILSDAGLKVVDFGLESASPSQLIRMGKTKDPERYLRKAEDIIKRLSEKNVWNKLNILLYAQETHETFNETKDWLLANRPYIKGISANPLTIYLNGAEDTLRYCDEIEEMTSRKIEKDTLLEKGYVSIDLSPEISHKDTESLCTELCGMMMSEKDYTDLKEICYMPRES